MERDKKLEAYLQENYAKWLRKANRLLIGRKIMGVSPEDLLQEMMIIACRYWHKWVDRGLMSREAYTTYNVMLKANDWVKSKQDNVVHHVKIDRVEDLLDSNNTSSLHEGLQGMNGPSLEDIVEFWQRIKQVRKNSTKEGAYIEAWADCGFDTAYMAKEHNISQYYVNKIIAKAIKAIEEKRIAERLANLNTTTKESTLKC